MKRSLSVCQSQIEAMVTTSHHGAGFYAVSPPEHSHTKMSGLDTFCLRLWFFIVMFLINQ